MRDAAAGTVIERLASTLDALARSSGAEDAGMLARLHADCADAVRLELDCMQQSLTPTQRAALARLDDVLESPARDPAEAARLARAALAALDLAPAARARPG